MTKQLDRLPVSFSYVEINRGGHTPVITDAVVTGDNVPRYQIGKLDFTSLNGTRTATGGLDEWMMMNDRTPMYLEHVDSTAPGGYWTDIEIRGTDVYARPYISKETSVGRDILGALRDNLIQAFRGE